MLLLVNVNHVIHRNPNYITTDEADLQGAYENIKDKRITLIYQINIVCENNITTTIMCALN